MAKNAYEEDELDLLIARLGGKLESVDTGIVIGEPVSLSLDNGDVVLDDIVRRNGGVLESFETGIALNEQFDLFSAEPVHG